jgi:hypothetical protein
MDADFRMEIFMKGEYSSRVVVKNYTVAYTSRVAFRKLNVLPQGIHIMENQFNNVTNRFNHPLIDSKIAIKLSNLRYQNLPLLTASSMQKLEIVGLQIKGGELVGSCMTLTKNLQIFISPTPP